MSRPLALVILATLASPAFAVDQPAELSRAPIRLDAAQQQAIGLTWGTAERRPVEKVIRTVGRLDFDERRLAQVTLKVSGFIEELYANYTGQPVRKGDPLFTLYSPELLTAQREYLLARETERRLRQSSLPRPGCPRLRSRAPAASGSVSGTSRRSRCASSKRAGRPGARSPSTRPSPASSSRRWRSLASGWSPA